MIRLDTTTRKLQVLLGGAITTNQLPVVVSYSDHTTTAYSGATQAATTNSTTPVDICDAPAASTVRDIDYINVRNDDTVSATVTIRYNDNGTIYKLVATSLTPGYSLVYTHGSGWQIIEALSAITAADVANVPAGNIAATNVQSALNELDSEKALLAGDSTQDFDALTLAAYEGLVVPKTSGKGIKVDPAAPTFPWRRIRGEIDYDPDTPATRPALATFRGGNVKAYQWAVNDITQIAYDLPHDYAPGTDIYLHLDWAHNSGSVASGSITVDISATYAKAHNQAAFPAEISTSINDSASTTQYQLKSPHIQLSTSGGSGSQLDSDNFEPGGKILLYAVLSANTISAATDPFIFALDIEYQSTGVGTKNKDPNFYS